MPVGHPDSADVRRHFFGRTIQSTSASLTANQFVGISIPEASIDDVAIVRVFGDPGVCIQIDSFGVSGDVVETWKLGLTTTWGSGRRIVVQPMGGGIDILVQDTTGVAGKTYVVQVDTYIGADQNQMRINHASSGMQGVVVGAGAFSPFLAIPDSQQFDEIDVWCASNVAGVVGLALLTENGLGTAGSMFEFQMATFATVTAFVAAVGKYPSAGIGMRVAAFNPLGGAATVAFGYRAVKLG